MNALQEDSQTKRPQLRSWVGWGGCGSFVVLLLIVFSATSATSEKSSKKSGILAASQQNAIAYEVLRQWTIPAGRRGRSGIGREFLVSEDATKEEVLHLARSLQARYSTAGALHITIYDSRGAYQAAEQLLDTGVLDYPEDEWAKHHLLNIWRGRHGGQDEIRWLATTRNH